MANWIFKAKIKKYFIDEEDFSNENIKEVANKVAEELGNFLKKIEKRFPEEFDEYEDIVIRFKMLSDDETANEDEFDYILTDLYDWADQSVNCNSRDKMMWIG